jgi:rubrerythrin
MNELRSTSELLEIAIRIERCLLELYKRMRDTIEHSLGRDIFDFLAAEEQVHIVMLRRFLDSCSDDESNFQLNERKTRSQNGLVVHAMRVFNRLQEATTTNDLIDALAIGIELETESIFYFTELGEMFLGEQNDLIARIRDDEKSHLLKLVALMKRTGA